jgi:hypothetical protein
MNAKEYLESKGVFGLDTKKRYNEVIGWMEGYAQEVVKNCSIPAVINSVAAPEWLTTERRAEAKMKYESHVFGDSNRVKAVEMIRMWAGLAGYTIGLEKASELLQQHCL